MSNFFYVFGVKKNLRKIKKEKKYIMQLFSAGSIVLSIFWPRKHEKTALKSCW